jgi:hypothetical protein
MRTGSRGGPASETVSPVARLAVDWARLSPSCPSCRTATQRSVPDRDNAVRVISTYPIAFTRTMTVRSASLRPQISNFGAYARL